MLKSEKISDERAICRSQPLVHSIRFGLGSTFDIFDSFCWVL